MGTPLNNAGVAVAQPPMGGLAGRLEGMQGQKFRRNVIWFLMALPALIWIFIFKYVTLFGIWIAFTSYKARRGVFGSDFVGFKNFEFLFATDSAVRAARNTVLLNLLFIVVGLMFALFVAWLMFEVYTSALTKYYQTLLLLPRFISWVVASYFVFALLATDNGVINGMLRSVGAEPVNWYTSAQYWPAILLFASLWNGVGISSLIYLAGMLAIDPQLYEAARIDGAGRWHQFTKITFPMILPLVVINLLLATAHIFNADFGLFFQIPRDQPLLYPITDVLDTFIYRALLVTQNVSMAAAAQVYQSVVGFGLVLFFNWVVRRIERHDEPLSLF